MEKILQNRFLEGRGQWWALVCSVFRVRIALVVVDCFSEYVGVDLVGRLDGEHAVGLLGSFFAGRGIPGIERSDGGANCGSGGLNIWWTPGMSNVWRRVLHVPGWVG